MARTPVTEMEFPLTGDMYELECPRHENNRYLWKGWGRTLHFVPRNPAEYHDCECSFESLVCINN